MTRTNPLRLSLLALLLGLSPLCPAQEAAPVAVAQSAMAPIVRL